MENKDLYVVYYVQTHDAPSFDEGIIDICAFHKVIMILKEIKSPIEIDDLISVAAEEGLLVPLEMSTVEEIIEFASSTKNLRLVELMLGYCNMDIITLDRYISYKVK